MATATVNLSVVRSSHSIRFRSSRSPPNAPNLLLYSHPKPCLTLSSVYLESNGAAKPRALTIALAHKTLSETEIVAVPLEPEEFTGKLPPDVGVYAVYDKNEELQFIGISRNIAASVTVHQKSVPDLCCSVKVWRAYEFVNDLIQFVARRNFGILKWKRGLYKRAVQNLKFSASNAN